MAGHNDLAHAMQAETSVQTVYEAGALVLRCRWWVLLACGELARRAFGAAVRKQVVAEVIVPEYPPIDQSGRCARGGQITTAVTEHRYNVVGRIGEGPAWDI